MAWSLRGRRARPGDNLPGADVDAAVSQPPACRARRGTEAEPSHDALLVPAWEAATPWLPGGRLVRTAEDRPHDAGLAGGRKARHTAARAAMPIAHAAPRPTTAQAPSAAPATKATQRPR